MGDRLKFLVIGDYCDDIWSYGQVNRLSPESPCCILNPINTISNPGMAGNVYENLKNLDKNIKVDFLHSSTECRKTRWVEKRSGYILLRIDENDKIEPISDKVLYNANIKDYDCVVISDYDKGTLNKKSIEYILNEAKLSFIDTKKIMLGEWFKNAGFIKINELEYNQNIKAEVEFNDNQLIVTLGENGTRYNGKTYPTQKIEVADVSGAGDSFCAALAYKYTLTKNIDESIDFANYIGGLACSKHGVVSKFDV